MASVLTLLLSHQQPAQLEQVLKCWVPVAGAESLLLAYGGPANSFPAINFPNKVFIDDERLRVRDQQRQFQSWRAVLRAGLEWLRSRPNYQFVHLSEYDHIPLIDDLHDRMLSRLTAEKADIVTHHLHRVDGTNFSHYLFHSYEERFHRYFASISRREDKRTILSMLPTGSLWTREAFEAVASQEEAIPVYVELYLPTLAHHLGFRVRELADQNPFVTAAGDRGAEIQSARLAGAWTLHPVKVLPPNLTSASRL